MYIIKKKKGYESVLLKKKKEKKLLQFTSNITNSIWFKMLIYGTPIQDKRTNNLLEFTHRFYELPFVVAWIVLYSF